VGGGGGGEPRDPSRGGGGRRAVRRGHETVGTFRGLRNPGYRSPRRRSAGHGGEKPEGGARHEDRDQDRGGTAGKGRTHGRDQRLRCSYPLGRPGGGPSLARVRRSAPPARNHPATGARRGIDKGGRPVPRPCRSTCCAGSATTLPRRRAPVPKSVAGCEPPPDAQGTPSSKDRVSRASNSTRPRAGRGSRPRPGCSGTRASAPSRWCPRPRRR
jgi:hypothetical protein